MNRRKGGSGLTELELEDRGGRLRIEEQGPRVLLSVCREDDGRGLYKAYLTGPSGGELLLGTLAPEGGALRTARLMSKGDLERRGLWPIRGGRVEMTFPFAPVKGWAGDPAWQRVEAPGRLMGESLLRKEAEKLRDVLCKKEGAGFALAAPYDPHMPFPLCPLFCFAGIQEIGGGKYAVFHFSSGGCPVFLG